MSGSHETVEWHLTPGGWVRGSESLDFGSGEKRPIPQDRVATFVIDEYMGSVYSRMQVSWEKRWQAPGTNIEPLLQEFGTYPPGVEQQLERFG